MSDNTRITIDLTQQENYQFRVEFGDAVPDLLADEPAPMGAGAGPSPVQLLAAAVGNCLCDSLLFALRKFKQAPDPLTCSLQAEMGRNEQGRIRVVSMAAIVRLGVPASQLEHLDRVLASFEQYCIVTQSVGLGIPITVQVIDANGVVLTP